MDATAVRLAVKLSPREIAAVRAALRHVQHEPTGLSDVARVELEADGWLSDPEIDSVVGVLSTAADVWVLAASGARVRVDDRLLQLVREAFDVFSDPASQVDVRDWTRTAKPYLRAEPDPRD